MLKILWERAEIAHEEQFLLLYTIFCYLLLDFHVETRIRFSLRDKRLFEMIEVEITRVDCSVSPRYLKHWYHKVLSDTKEFGLDTFLCFIDISTLFISKYLKVLISQSTL